MPLCATCQEPGATLSCNASYSGADDDLAFCRSCFPGVLALYQGYKRLEATVPSRLFDDAWSLYCRHDISTYQITIWRGKLRLALDLRTRLQARLQNVRCSSGHARWMERLRERARRASEALGLRYHPERADKYHHVF